ncbi:MAG: hypothetical protein IH873_02255 [Chloroflexi bacterium]|nr:hypothetical protein [Chloroflexota bacterium]
MKRLGVILVPIMLLALACGEAATPETPLPPDLEATIRALVGDAQSAPQFAGEPDTEATITARVQATVQALLEATPIPSPTPTLSGSLFITTPSPTRSSPSNLTTVPAPTATSVPRPTSTPTPTPAPTPSPTRQAGCSPAADGVEVSAWVNGALAASALVESGRYSLLVEQPSGGSFSGQTITFTVGYSDASQTVVWMQGGATELNLTAPNGGLGRLAPDDVGRPSITGGPLAQPVLPHVILGTVSVGDC